MIKNLLLSGALLSVPALMLNAETKVYTMDELGDEIHVSPNGKFVCVGDLMYQQNKSYLWSAENPETFALLPGEVTAYDVDNNGTVVGSMEIGHGISRACILVNGEWLELPSHEAVVNTAEANCITGDGTLIAGTQFINDPTSEIQGRYYPCIWKKGEDGNWNLTAYTGIKLPDHQGFISKCLYVNGEDIVIGGRLYTDFGSCVPAIIVNGELKYWNKLETKMLPFIWNGKYEIRDENGRQQWTDDPNNPNISLYPEYFVDGIHDGRNDKSGDGTAFNGELTTVDKHGNFYGYRTRAFDVDEEGNGTLVNGGTIYNYIDDEWIDNPDYTLYSTGLSEKNIIFTLGDCMIMDGEKTVLTETFGFSVNRDLSSIRSVSEDGKVWAGNLSELHPATGDYIYYPLVIVLDEPLVAGIDDVVSENGITIIVSAGRVDVAGTDDVTIYDLKGSVVSNAVTSYVAPGMYIVKAGDTTRKVFVK